MELSPQKSLVVLHNFNHYCRHSRGRFNGPRACTFKTRKANLSHGQKVQNANRVHDFHHALCSENVPITSYIGIFIVPLWILWSGGYNDREKDLMKSAAWVAFYVCGVIVYICLVMSKTLDAHTASPFMYVATSLCAVNQFKIYNPCDRARISVQLENP